jgi:hypothetical protein
MAYVRFIKAFNELIGHADKFERHDRGSRHLPYPAGIDPQMVLHRRPIELIDGVVD